MVMLTDADVTNPEVATWQGLHLLHFSGSTCSKKVRIALDLKGLQWESHPVNLVTRENYSEWFMGINPRGLVPVMVHDGQVMIESNDILDYLDQLCPSPPLKPENKGEDLARLLKLEDSMHMDLRNLTMRFTAPQRLMRRSNEEMDKFAKTGSGTVGGEPDAHKSKEEDYWRSFGERGITDDQVKNSAASFRSALDDLEQRLERNKYLLGNQISLADIAWFINCRRIQLAGYPIKRLHPRVDAWLIGLIAQPAFATEAAAPLIQQISASIIGLRDTLKGQTLSKVAGF